MKKLEFINDRPTMIYCDKKAAIIMDILQESYKEGYLYRHP